MSKMIYSSEEDLDGGSDIEQQSSHTQTPKTAGAGATRPSYLGSFLNATATKVDTNGVPRKSIFGLANLQNLIDGKEPENNSPKNTKLNKSSIIFSQDNNDSEDERDKKSKPTSTLAVPG